MKTTVLLLMFGLSSVLCYKERRAKDRNKAKLQLNEEVNLCAVERDFFDSIRCLCTRENSPLNASTVECWIFGEVSPEHVVWKLISRSQPSLTELSFVASNQGYLRFVPRRLIERMSKLRNLTITYAVIKRLEKFSFANSTTLEKLILSKNQISELEPFSIAHLPSLLELNLEDNRLQEIPAQVFYNVPNLKYVFFNNNNISKIHDKAFAALSRVIDIDLSQNYLNELNQLTFFGLGELRYIDLSFNKIVHLEGFVFSELWNVEDLNLDYNNIEFISNRAFNGLQFLKTIRLSNNRLRRLSEGLLNSAFTLYHLDLRNNRLETLLFDAVKQFYNNLLNKESSLLISGNQFTCDCRLKWMYSLRNETANANTRNSLDELVCYLFSDNAFTTEVAVFTTPHPVNEIDEVYSDSKIIESEAKFSTSNKYYGAKGNQVENVDYPEIFGKNEVFLLAIPLQELPCPVEYRPTPITIKQVTTFYSEATLTSNSGNVCRVMWLVLLFTQIMVLI